MSRSFVPRKIGLVVCFVLLNACTGSLSPDGDEGGREGSLFLPSHQGANDAPPLPGGGGGGSPPITPPININAFNPYDVTNPTTLAENRKFFAEQIQPILQGTSPYSTPENRCMTCHVSGRFGIIGFNAAQADPPSPDDPRVIENYNAFFTEGLVALGSPEMVGSRALAVLRTNDGMDLGIPGVPHGFKGNAVGSPEIYGKFKEWLLKEAPSRAPQGLGYYWNGFKQLCWIARERNDWALRPQEFRRYAEGVRPKIFCQGINNNHQLTGTLTDVTALLDPPMPQYYDFERLVANYGVADDGVTEQYRLYTSVRFGREQRENLFNVMEINFQIGADKQITGATWRYVLKPEYLNQKYIRIRTSAQGEGLGEATYMERYPDDYVSDVLATGEVIFDSNRGDPLEDQLSPTHPWDQNPHVQNPAIERTTIVNFPGVYGGEARQVFFADREGKPRLLIMNREQFSHEAVLGLNGKAFASAYFFRNTADTWIQQFKPLREGNSDLLPPFLNKTTKPLLVGKWGQMAYGSMGHLLIAQRDAVGDNVQPGHSIQVAYHDLGVDLRLSNRTKPVDQEDPAPLLYDNGVREAMTANCVNGQGRLLHGLFRNPARSIYEATFIMDASLEDYDLCQSPAVAPANMGIYHTTHRGVLTPILRPQDRELPGFGHDWFSDGHALLIRRQRPISFEKDQSVDRQVALIHIPNVAGFLATRTPDATGRERLFNDFAERITHVRVCRDEPETLSGTSRGKEEQIDSATGKATAGYRGIGHSATFATHEMPKQCRLLGDVPVQPDLSAAFFLPSLTAYNLQFVTTRMTNIGPMRVAIFSDSQVRISQPGYNEHSAFVSMSDYNANCASCHGTAGDTFTSIEEMWRSPGPGVTVDRKNTLAIANPVNFLDTPTGPYMDYKTMVAPFFASRNCVACHGATPWTWTGTDRNGQPVTKHFDDVNPAGGLTFEEKWHPTATDRLQSIRYTNFVLSGVNAGRSHGAEAPLSPPYLLLRKTAQGNDIGAGLYLTNTTGIRGVDWGAETRITLGKKPLVQCPLLFAALGVFLDCPSTGPIGFDGEVFQPLPLISNPQAGIVNYDHAGQLSLTAAQAIIYAIDNGWDYGSDPTLDLAPSYSIFHGEYRGAHFSEHLP